MKQVIYIATHKETKTILSGARGQAAFFDKSTLGRSMGQAGNLKGTYDVHEINPLRLIPQGKFEINILEGKNWNGESRIEFDSPAGSFSCGSLSECPEDATLERDLSFVHDIDSMMRKAHEAGLRGDEFVVNYEEEDDE